MNKIQPAPLGKEIREALGLRACSILHGRGNDWNTMNSVVFSIPAMTQSDLATICSPKNVTCSLVRVMGPTAEPLHFHTSYIVGLIVSGEGILLNRGIGNFDRSDVVSIGDIVVIPRGAPHVFTTRPEGRMEYIALEFSDREIDYQAHLPM